MIDFNLLKSVADSTEEIDRDFRSNPEQVELVLLTIEQMGYFVAPIERVAELRNALVGCERAAEELAYAGHKDAAERIFAIVGPVLEIMLMPPSVKLTGGPPK